MSDKIWVIGNTVYRTEAGFLKAIEEWSDWAEYQVFTGSKRKSVKELKLKLKAEKEANDRDMAISAVLGELTPSQERELSYADDIRNLINIVSDIAFYRIPENGGLRRTRNCKLYSDLCKYKDDRKAMLRYLKSHRGDIFTFSDSVEYFKALLKIHNFKEPTQMKAVYVTGKGYVMKDKLNIDQRYKDAFYKAKGK